MLRMSVDGVWFEFAARELVLESTFISGIDAAASGHLWRDQ
jgi:hypothetical protein